MAKTIDQADQNSKEAIMVVEKVAQEVSKFIDENKDKRLQDFDIQIRQDCVNKQNGLTIDIEYI